MFRKVIENTMVGAMGRALLDGRVEYVLSRARELGALSEAEVDNLRHDVHRRLAAAERETREVRRIVDEFIGATFEGLVRGATHASSLIDGLASTLADAGTRFSRENGGTAPDSPPVTPPRTGRPAP